MACTLGALEYMNREHGGVEGYAKKLGGLENITVTLDVSREFIRQGIAKYKLERGDDLDEGICLETPTREELELTLDVDDLGGLTDSILEAIMRSRKNKIAAKPSGNAKKNEA